MTRTSTIPLGLITALLNRQPRLKEAARYSPYQKSAFTAHFDTLDIRRTTGVHDNYGDVQQVFEKGDHLLTFDGGRMGLL